MSHIPHYFTSESLRKYQAYIAELQERLRGMVAQINEAYETGGYWHDNAALDHLTYDIQVADGHLKDAMLLLKDADTIEYPKSVDRVMLGADVRLSIDGRPDRFQIVAYGDSDEAADKIVYESPLAKALMGHKPGDRFTAEINGRKLEISVVSVAPIAA